MERTDALDLLVQTVCRMHWTAPQAVALETGDDPESSEEASAVFDPLLDHADAAIELISLCEMLLDKHRAELDRRARRLDEAKSAFGNHREAEENFTRTLQKRFGEPLGDDGRFSHAQVRLIITGHEAPKRGDEPLKEIWTAARSIPWLPKKFDTLGDDSFSKAADKHVRKKGLEAWQLQMLAPFATKLGKKKLSAI